MPIDFSGKSQSHRLLIRPAKPNDLMNVLELYRHLNESDQALPEGPARDRLWANILAHPGLTCVVGEYQNELISSCCLVVVPNLTRGGRPYALIENVVTHRDFRKQGFGTAIVKHALSLAWNSDCYKAMLFMGSKRPETRRFYEQCGFRSDDKTAFVARP